MKEQYKILNIGCGLTRIPNSIGIDVAAIPNTVDFVQDLNLLPYPFEDKTFDEVIMYHVLEHLESPIKVLEEIHRILRPGGHLHIRVPHFSSSGAFTDMTHKRPFGYYSFDSFEFENDQHYYTRVNFSIVGRQLRYLGNYPRVGPYQEYLFTDYFDSWIKYLALPVNFLMNLSPRLFERVWCSWVGGALEIYVCLEKND